MGIIENMKRAWAAFGEKPAARKPEIAESAPMKADLYMMQWVGASGEIMNIDPLLSLSGTDQFTAIYDVYREMLIKWPHARHCLRKRQNAVLARPLKITAASDEERDVAAADFVRKVLGDIAEFRDDLRELLDAIWFGFAVSEIIWGVGGRSGQSGQAVLINKIMSRNPDRFRFGWDGGLMLDTGGTRTGFAAAPENKFLVHSYNKEHEIPYGWGEARYCYWYYFFAKNALKFWSLFTEKFAMPTAVGKYPPGIGKSEQDSLLNTLRAMQNDQAVRIPDNMVIELLEAQRAGSLDCYQNYIRYLELSVSKAILGGTLSSDEGQFGTRAQAEVHEEGRFEFTEADCKALAGTLKEQLIRPLILFNFGSDAALPTCSFEGDEVEDLKSRAETDEILVRMGVPLGIKYFYETYKRPAPEDGEETARQLRITNSEGSNEEQFAEGKKADSERIAREWWDLEEKYIEAAIAKGGKFYIDLMREILGMFERSEDASAVWAIRGGMFDVDVAPLANYLSWAIFTAELNGQEEINKLRITNSKLQNKAEFKENRDGYVFEPLPPAEAIKWFEGLLPMTRDEFDSLLRGARDYAFTVADIQSRDVIEKVQDSLTKSLSEGKTFGDWKKGIRGVFEAEGVTEKSDFRMRTIFQTNIHNALVEGRDRAMGDLADNGIIKLARWQSVGDSRVREEHQALDGQVFAWDDLSVWRKLKSYNCRCQKVPVFN
jgi:SPP1 gp7 family putative phage head morphogenesis protein